MTTKVFRKIQFILIFLLFTIANVGFAQEKQLVITHTVEKGQTLYSIAKQYNTSVEEVRNQNPSIDETYAIQPGQLIVLKVDNNKENQQAITSLNKVSVLHLVQEQETMYSLSKLYAVSIEEIQKWNNIASTDIQVGDELIVGYKYENKQSADATSITNTPQPEEKIVETQPVVAQPTRQVPEREFNQTDKQEVLKQRQIADGYGLTKSNAEGVAIWFNSDNRLMSSKYYGLFSDVPVGSVIAVTNLMNNKVVYVKVIGGLPDTAENAGALVKLTPASKKLLATSDGKIRVKVSYYK